MNATEKPPAEAPSYHTASSSESLLTNSQVCVAAYRSPQAAQACGTHVKMRHFPILQLGVALLPCQRHQHSNQSTPPCYLRDSAGRLYWSPAGVLLPEPSFLLCCHLLGYIYISHFILSPLGWKQTQGHGEGGGTPSSHF